MIVTGFDSPLPYAPGHRGLDLAASAGLVVVAARSGTVTVAGPVAGRPIVVISHGAGVRTTYLPVDPLVSVGERVDVGQPIGVVAAVELVGHCGSTSCLHWGARRGDEYIDPRSLLPTAPIVLLPNEPSG
jgi:murein DD-endopeptidase MepM/ murein hydrolase activator NlpD